MPAPEFNQARGVESGRVSLSQMLAKINTGLVQKFGEGKWLLGASAASLLLDKKLIVARSLNLDAVAEEARRLILLDPSIGTAYTRAELLANSRAGAPFFEASRKAWHPDVSGEVQFTIRANFMFGSSTSIATHGSPHPYDTHVPILVYGPKWVKAGRVDRRVEVVDIAPSLSRILGVAAPAMSEGKQLPLP